MKNISFSLFILFFLAYQSLSAQTNLISKKNNFSARVGIGLVPTYMTGDINANILPLSTTIGYNFSNNFSLNAFAGYASYEGIQQYTQDQFRNFENNSLVIGLRPEFNKMVSDRIEIYGGFMVGFHKSFIDEYMYEEGSNQRIKAPEVDGPSFVDPNTSNSGAILSGFVGGTFLVNEKLGIFGEIGYGVSLVNFGATFKL